MMREKERAAREPEFANGPKTVNSAESNPTDSRKSAQANFSDRVFAAELAPAGQAVLLDKARAALRSWALPPERKIAFHYAHSPLTPAHLEYCGRRFITPEIARIEGLRSVDHETGAALLGRHKPKLGECFSGIAIPFFRLQHDGSLYPSLIRIRRDRPDQDPESGKPVRKILSPYEAPPRVFEPRYNELHAEAQLIVFTESELKAIAFARCLHEAGRDALVYGLTGVYGFLGKIGKKDRAEGPGKIRVNGFIPDLEAIKWDGKSVVILYDANVHANGNVKAARQKLAHHLTIRGADVRFVDIPNDIEGVDGIDDLLFVKGPEFTLTLFDQQLRIAEIQRAEFYAGEQQDMPLLAARVWPTLDESEAIQGRTLFWAGGQMVRVQPQGDRATIEDLTVDRMRYRLAMLARWYREKHVAVASPDASTEGVVDLLAKRKKKQTETQRCPALPPLTLVRHLLAAPQADTPLPVLKGVVTAPVFTADGDILTEPGFHETSGLYYLETFNALPVPEKPSSEEAASALKLIESELLPDFPFAGKGDWAHALALLLLPFVREMINGPTPLHLIEAAMRGSGKSLLATLLLYPALGNSGIGTAPQPEDDAEMSRLITANLVSGKGALLFDNLSRALDSGTLANALTTSIWEGRILGANRLASAPVRLIWVATANNPTISSEITRRTVRIRLVPDTDTPEKRTGFRHPFIKEWLEENRPRIVQAVHVIVRYWLIQGRPSGRAVLGSFENWARVIGGILETIGRDSLLANYSEFRDQADIERAARGAFCDIWWEQILREQAGGESRSFEAGYVRATARKLFELAQNVEGLPLNGIGTDGLAKSLGRYLAGCNEMIVEHVEKDADGKALYARKFQIRKAGSRKGSVLWTLDLKSEEKYAPM